MGGKRWTAAEVSRLYFLATCCSQAVAGAKLGRHPKEVARKAKALGIKWRQGSVSVAQLQAEFGCAGGTVVRAINILLHDEIGTYYGTGTARRYRLTDEQADRVRALLSRTRQTRQQQIKAGRRRWSATTTGVTDE